MFFEEVAEASEMMLQEEKKGTKGMMLEEEKAKLAESNSKEMIDFRFGTMCIGAL